MFKIILCQLLNPWIHEYLKMWKSQYVGIQTVFKNPSKSETFLPTSKLIWKIAFRFQGTMRIVFLDDYWKKCDFFLKKNAGQILKRAIILRDKFISMRDLFTSLLFFPLTYGKVWKKSWLLLESKKGVFYLKYS